MQEAHGTYLKFSLPSNTLIPTSSNLSKKSPQRSYSPRGSNFPSDLLETVSTPAPQTITLAPLTLIRSRWGSKKGLPIPPPPRINISFSFIYEDLSIRSEIDAGLNGKYLKGGHHQSPTLVLSALKINLSCCIASTHFLPRVGKWPDPSPNATLSNWRRSGDTWCATPRPRFRTNDSAGLLLLNRCLKPSIADWTAKLWPLRARS